MKYLIIFRLTIIFLIGVSFNQYTYSQTVKVITASCGKCGQSVPETSSYGGTCPNCGIRWSKKNKNTSLRKSEKVIKVPNFELHPFSREYADAGPDLSEKSTIIRKCKLLSSPGIGTEIIGFIPKNSSIYINKRKLEWLKITYIGKLDGEINTYIGWIHSSNVVW